MDIYTFLCMYAYICFLLCLGAEKMENIRKGLDIESSGFWLLWFRKKNKVNSGKAKDVAGKSTGIWFSLLFFIHFFSAIE
jgi:hypothetical protein